jgi:hypothetical protein
VNIRFEYLYRDAGNYKNWGEVVFKNNNNLDVESLDRKVRNVLIDSEYFVAEKVSVPSLQFEEYIEALDHGWHEFHMFDHTSAEPNDILDRDVHEFIQCLESASRI